MKVNVSAFVGGKEVVVETGHMAKQADGAVVAKCGNNIVLVTVVSAKEKSDLDFFPLTCEYQEKFYSTGKIPGGYFKREGKPTTEATLTARQMDRPIRPVFPEGYRNDTQVVATVLSSDGLFPLEVLASLGTSACIHISDVPFNGPTASVVVGRVDGQLVLNPNPEQLEKSDLEITIAGTKQGILMVEGEARFISEADALSALKFGHQGLQPLLSMQEELRAKAGKPKRAFTAPEIDAGFRNSVESLVNAKVTEALNIRTKMERYARLGEIKHEAIEHLTASITDEKLHAQKEKEIDAVFGEVKYKIAREMILKKGHRIDGRDLKSIRQIDCEVALLPRAHGSGLFTRGETQVLGTVTLGTGEDEQMIDGLSGVTKQRFMLHYNFPPYSVGETGRIGFTSRRELGHGNLAYRALKSVLPDFNEFPYTIRIVSEVLESNGSSSMGTVCAGTLALLDAGVPIKGNVAGIAMGLIKEGDQVAVLTDILGDEDHLGDMDFKVAGTRDGITSVQMDIKIDSIDFDIMEKALAQAKEGRNFILGKMEAVIAKPRGEISEFAPRIETIQIKPEKVREVIGAGGKVIRAIIEETGVKIDIEDDGKIHIASSDPQMTKKAIQLIRDICAEPEIGKVYNGRVVKIADFGAFIEILPNIQGLLHVSEIAHERIRRVADVIKEGEMIDVKVLDIDRAGRIKLSRKVLLNNNPQS